MILIQRLRRRMGRAAPHPASEVPMPGEETIDQDTGEVLQSAPTTKDAASNDGRRPVPGDRGILSVNRERSLQSRVTTALALGTCALVGGGFLVWYYASLVAQPSAAQAAERRAQDARGADAPVPALGRVDPPHLPATAAAQSTTSGGMPDWLRDPPPAPPPPAGPTTTATATPPPKSPQQLALERQLGQPVLWRQASTGRAPVTSATTNPGAAFPIALTAMASGTSSPSAEEPPAGPTAVTLEQQLRPTYTPAVAAQLMPDRHFLLAKGASIDCTLETAIDSTFDGLVTCIGATDVYSADGKVVLLERGTRYVGEKRGEARLGQNRVFVLWSEARTPTGVSVALASPGTDALGRAGLPGQADNHFWDRFGAALLISVIDGSLQALSANRQGGNGNSVVIGTGGARDVMTEVLKSTVAIPPTIVLPQGQRAQILVARDLDFRSVYTLRAIDESR
jgi:type IV secretion system protein VirB10